MSCPVKSVTFSFVLPVEALASSVTLGTSSVLCFGILKHSSPGDPVMVSDPFPVNAALGPVTLQSVIVTAKTGAAPEKKHSTGLVMVAASVPESHSALGACGDTMELPLPPPAPIPITRPKMREIDRNTSLLV